MTAGIPITYVPARNTVFLSLALAWAETLGAFDIFIGVNCVDYSGYPDCRPEYLEAFEAMANVATRAGVEGLGRFRIHVPLIRWTKDQIILRGLELGVDYGLTHSCYDPASDGRACGRCDSCLIRLWSFRMHRPHRSGCLCTWRLIACQATSIWFIRNDAPRETQFTSCSLESLLWLLGAWVFLFVALAVRFVRRSMQ